MRVVVTDQRRDVSAQEPPTPHLGEHGARTRLDRHAEAETAVHRQTLQAPDHGSATRMSKASFLRLIATGGHDRRQEQKRYASQSYLQGGTYGKTERASRAAIASAAACS